MIGGTPYDRRAATAGDVTGIGLLSGLPRAALLASGAIDVLPQIAELKQLISSLETAHS